MYKPRLSGSHRDMGFHYGSMLRKKGVDLFSILPRTQQRLEMGRACMDYCRGIYPQIVDEIEGMAEGLDLPELEFATFILTAGAYSFEVGCTAFAFRGGKDVYVTRNHDMFVQLKKTTEATLCRPEEGAWFLAHGDGLIGKEDGINEHGFAVGMTFVAPTAIRPGMNFMVLVRWLLETCSTVAEGLEKLATVKVVTSQCLLLADSSGDMAVVELSPDARAVRRAGPGEEFIVATNQFNDPSMRIYDNRPIPNWYHTTDRFETVTSALATATDRDRLLGPKIASGRTPGFVCGYERSLKFDTLWSVCYCLNDLSVLRAEGNPARVRFKEDRRLVGAIERRTRTRPSKT